jgi:hypothetical protein
LPMKYPTSCSWAQSENQLLITSARLSFRSRRNDGRTRVFTL